MIIILEDFRILFVSIKIKIRKNNNTQQPILVNRSWPSDYEKDGELARQIEKFLIENAISYRTTHFWNPKTRKGFVGKKYLNHITFYKQQDVNLFKLSFVEKLKIEDMK